jgi:hypothetical protein
MLNKCFIPLFALLSVSAFADVSFEEKKNRVEYLEELSSEAVSMNIDAYRRELEYERQNISLEQRAENEANLLAEKIKVQIQRAYEAALENKSTEEAVEEVRSAVEKDLELVAPELREEIRAISFAALEGAQRGQSSLETDLSQVEKVLLKGVTDRSNFLNEKGEEKHQYALTSDGSLPSANKNRDAEKKEYATKAEVLESLVSDRDSARWVSTSNMTVTSDQITKTDAKISLQVKVNFLGVALEAGPTISFKRTFKTSATVMTEGLNPVLLPDGNFDFLRRDREGKVMMKGGKVMKRFINFNCDAALDFETDYSGGGGFSVEGVGVGASITRTYSNNVSLSSRRVVVPEFINNKSVTLKNLAQLCHFDFLKTKITNTMDVAGSLNIMMKNVVAGIRFSHPKTKCITNNHCAKWFKHEVLALSKIGNIPKCIEDRGEKFRTCKLRGLKGQNCTVFDSKGKRVSDGGHEFTCDTGLKCVKVQQEGWFQGWSIYQYAKGRCMPVK